MRANLTGLLVVAVVVAIPARGMVRFKGMDTVAPFLECQSREVNDFDNGKMPIAVVARHVAVHCQRVYSKMETTLVRLYGVGFGQNYDLAVRAVEHERRAKFEASQQIRTTHRTN